MFVEKSQFELEDCDNITILLTTPIISADLRKNRKITAKMAVFLRDLLQTVISGTRKKCNRKNALLTGRIADFGSY